MQGEMGLSIGTIIVSTLGTTLLKWKLHGDGQVVKDRLMEHPERLLWMLAYGYDAGAS
jgi:hypothetical protein